MPLLDRNILHYMPIMEMTDQQYELRSKSTLAPSFCEAHRLAPIESSTRLAVRVHEDASPCVQNIAPFEYSSVCSAGSLQTLGDPGTGWGLG